MQSPFFYDVVAGLKSVSSKMSFCIKKDRMAAVEKILKKFYKSFTKALDRHEQKSYDEVWLIKHNIS